MATQTTARTVGRRFPRSAPPGADLRQIDYDLHGLAGIRLVDASPKDAAAVARQLGPIEAPLDREPDIVVRFVDRLTTSSRLRYLGLGEGGFTDDAFFVLRSKHKAPAKVRVEFAELGGRCEIVCERGLAAVPMLIPIVNLTVLRRGAAPLHASAFVYEGTGVVATGWSKGGKTEALLAFLSHGAEYVGDEWVYVSPDGERVHGIPEPIRVWDWHLHELPEYRTLLGTGDRARLAAIRSVVALEISLAATGASGLAPVRALTRLSPLLRRQLFVDVPPETLLPGGLGALSARFDRLFFLASHEEPHVAVEELDPLDVARRMVFSHQHERLDFLSYYLKFRFAFPNRINPII
ncbi:MAG: hypothetical protein ACRDNE_00800, partial [Gaiellaceae bacterium]